MQPLILEPTSQSQWQALVQEAQASCDHRLDETLESYLVFLLMRFCKQPDCTSRIIAEDYFNSQTCTGELRIERLRDVGDHCLLFSGMFPQLAERRLVRVSYFVNLGRSSYQQLSDMLDHSWSAVYEHLSHAFVVLMDILHAMRELGGDSILTPLQAMDLWQDTGSRRCYQQMAASSTIPLAGTSEKH
ncbi:MAG: hypothetical protein JSU75_00385 [Gammaproteobacteria bacterium]|nr:MAG: hypothetical protein JSU75_00385 [Gammaproteobacteria bacterium]